ncbi:hypothetical protein QMK19_00055 [Streptomyces sp. H10-C2]|uniref:hypothetical protein n=1 Tax=unclassified Streptomyces TaxID=2593676 RepID=UPI0024BA60F2|nr:MULTISPECIES: hypothetical protein [unclassified Streptomyces]MDJ0340436.1 hypothetical protein [Streptomyces sp. PH10-H1]MDJ0368116.1 hypothetical protein [Streptomyces sp. H10-C2]
METHHSTVPASVRETIDGIVAAVRTGDDARIRALIERLTPDADVPALLLLHGRLNEDLTGRPAPACDTDQGAGGDQVVGVDATLRTQAS